jgi:hypothetical protein
MTHRTAILSRFSDSGGGESTFYLPDLTLWYDWHQSRGTLPPAWQGRSLPDVARAMGVPVWLPVRPWQVEHSGVDIVVVEREGERVVRSITSAGELVARWTVGPDGDWWQTEYPVKDSGDLPAALEVVKARSYRLDPAHPVHLKADVGDDGILALEIPRRPYSDLLHEFLGWSEGLMLLYEAAVQEMLAVLEDKLQPLVQEVAQLAGDLVFSPDNLDGQYISPRMFKKDLSASYLRTAEILREHGKRLVVHVGGPIRHLLAPLAEAGVAGIEGIAGPPQSNATLTEAREIAGEGLVLWGGIPQDFLIDSHDRQAFENAVGQAVQEVRVDGRMILGVADRVPVDAELDRLQDLPRLIEAFS